MNTQELHKLPFWETVGRSFKYVFKNKALIKAALPVVGALAVLQMIIGLPLLCSFTGGNCAMDATRLITLLSLLVASVGIIINYCRTIVCKAEVDFVSLKFWKRLAFYLAASFVLSLVILAPSFVCIFGAALFFNAVGLGNLAVASSVLIPFIFAIVFAPLFMVFPAIAVEDYKILSFKKLFQLVKGNHNAVFWGQFLLMMPYWVLFQAFTALYMLIGVNTYVVNLIFVIIGLALGIMDACFKGAFFAHIYQFFKFYEKE